MDISQFNPGMELAERNQLSVSRTRKEPGIVCQMPKMFIFSDELPGWENTEIWNYTTRRMNSDFVMTRIEIRKDGGTEKPVNNGCENFFYVVSGNVTVSFSSEEHKLEKDGYCWIPPHVPFEMVQKEEETAVIVWIKKIYEPLKDVKVPEAFVGNANNVEAKGTTAEYMKELVPASTDFGFDMSLNIMIFYPGVTSERTELHMASHGIFVLDGRGDVVVNKTHYEAHENDFFYIAPNAPHYYAGYAPKPLCMLIYEETNRDYAL